jgi:4-hydroxybenzoyl-CoA thioesterase
LTYAAEFPVRFGEIDHARVVYYPRFFHYFHQAFERWFEEALGVSYPELVNGQNIGFPAVRVETDFTAPLRYGDRVRIEIELAEIGDKSITLRYTAIRLPDGVVSARARITTVAIDNDSFQSIAIPQEWRERFEHFRSGRRPK